MNLKKTRGYQNSEAPGSVSRQFDSRRIRLRDMGDYGARNRTEIYRQISPRARVRRSATESIEIIRVRRRILRQIDYSTLSLSLRRWFPGNFCGLGGIQIELRPLYLMGTRGNTKLLVRSFGKPPRQPWDAHCSPNFPPW